jgi:hypothetical protein
MMEIVAKQSVIKTLFSEGASFKMAEPVTIIGLVLAIMAHKNDVKVDDEYFMLASEISKGMKAVSFADLDDKLEALISADYQAAAIFLEMASSQDVPEKKREAYLDKALDLLILSYSRFDSLGKSVDMGETSFRVATVFALQGDTLMAKQWYERSIANYQSFLDNPVKPKFLSDRIMDGFNNGFNRLHETKDDNIATALGKNFAQGAIIIFGFPVGFVSIVLTDKVERTFGNVAEVEQRHAMLISEVEQKVTEIQQIVAGI